jgi:hypothetical protein
VQKGISKWAEWTDWHGSSVEKFTFICFVPSMTSFLPIGVHISLVEQMITLTHTSNTSSILGFGQGIHNLSVSQN